MLGCSLRRTGTRMGQRHEHRPCKHIAGDCLGPGAFPVSKGWLHCQVARSSLKKSFKQPFPLLPPNSMRLLLYMQQAALARGPGPAAQEPPTQHCIKRTAQMLLSTR
jgi:hypothetical protein